MKKHRAMQMCERNCHSWRCVDMTETVPDTDIIGHDAVRFWCVNDINSLTNTFFFSPAPIRFFGFASQRAEDRRVHAQHLSRIELGIIIDHLTSFVIERYRTVCQIVDTGRFPLALVARARQIFHSPFENLMNRRQWRLIIDINWEFRFYSACTESAVVVKLCTLNRLSDNLAVRLRTLICIAN